MLYHLSFDVFNKIEEFKPRIPKNRIKEEDRKVKRICCSNSIEGCLLAMPNNNEILLSEKGIYPLIKVYEFKEEDIEEGYLYFPKDIEKKVPDAITTKEHWIMSNIKASSSYIISIDSLKYDTDVKKIKDFKYSLLLEEEVLDISDYYSYIVKAKATDETSTLIEKLYNNYGFEYDIEEVSDLMSAFEIITKETLSEIVDDYECHVEEGDGYITLNVDGFYIGDYREGAYIYKNKDVAKNIYNDLLNLADLYKLEISVS